MQTNNLVKETTDAYGRRLNVKWISLGSIFRQVVLSRPSVNYFHYIWPICLVLSGLGATVLIVQKYFEKIPSLWIVVLTMICILASCIYSMLTDVVEESIQVIDSFGIQLSSKTRSGRENKIFFDFNSVHGVIINEAITMQRVIFYLALETKHKESTEEETTSNFKERTRLITVFKSTVPRLDIIQDIYHEVRSFLTSNNNGKED